MFDRETRWFVRCDTCPDIGVDPYESLSMRSQDNTVRRARRDGWEITDDLHRCPDCVREGRTVVAS
jgi:hypothetical protein